MSATWDFPGGNVIRLTLDGTGSGEKSATRTFTGLTPDSRYTFYLGVDTDIVAINAFLEVDGGDTTVADVAGAQSLRARGVSDGSGNITVRFGAQTIEAAPDAVVADGLEYATVGALDAVWPESDTLGGISTWSIETSVVKGGTYAAKLTVIGTATNGQESVRTRTFTASDGIAPSTSYTILAWVWLNEEFGVNTGHDLRFGIRIPGGAQSVVPSPGGSGAINDWRHLTLSATSNSSSELTIEFGAFDSSNSTHNRTARFDDIRIETVGGGGIATVDFTGLTYCSGSGETETGGTGLGQGATDNDPGDDPIPTPPSGGYPPPPVGGARPYGAFEIPPEGLGFWNSTIKQMSPIWVINLLNAASTASATLWLTGRWKAWLDGSGRFSYDLWKVDIDAVYNDTTAGAALSAAITSGTAKAHYVIDEPFHPTRYGGPLALAIVERMCDYSKSLWPTWPTAIRVPPTKAEVTRHISGLDWLWAQYSTNKGDVTAFRDRELARAATLGHGMVIGVNIADFLGTNTRPVTPDEYDHYGTILASSSDPVAFMNWRYETALYTSAFLVSDKRVRDTLGSNDP